MLAVFLLSRDVNRRSLAGRKPFCFTPPMGVAL